MQPHVAMDLANILRDRLLQDGSTAIDPHLQVLAALRFFGEGAYQKGVGQDFNHPISQTTTSRCLNDVVNALVSIAGRYIKFPQTREELHRVEERY